MRFSIILAAAASVTIVAAQDFSTCKDTSAVISCASPFSSAMTDCSTSDTDCICKNGKGALDCFDKHCPEVAFPGRSTIESQCGSSSGGGSSSDDSKTDDKSDDEPEANDDTSSSSNEPEANDDTSGSNNGPAEGAGASLFAPAGGLLAAIVAAAAML
ncbi:hypothetical protein V493_01902 [Pseudogymnoascus sp. VKM F-4281 (FW-2241)]|nr:hypothetical protein V493_01902 [Pseudogymnoascus sp. VKM F-4281 (FW-2241)]